MERIKKGLERARIEREQQRHPVQLSTAPVTRAPAARREALRASEKIAFVHTRRINVDPEHLRRNRIIYGLSDPAAAWYSVLRTKVAHRMRDNNWKSLAITSPGAGAGKSVTAINLAISLAREVDRNVLLVDLDLRAPRLRSHFTDEPMPGVSDLLQGRSEVHELLVNPGIERLVLLPGNESLPNAAEMLSSPRMADLVEELRNRYPDRLVLFDMPPVLLCDDVLAFSPFFQAALLVLEEGVTSRVELEQSLQLLEKTHLLGTVVNKSHSRATATTPAAYVA